MVFLAVVYTTYRLLPHRAQNVMLLVASYGFYAAWDWRFLGLLVLSTVVDYAVGLMMERSKSTRGRRLLLIATLATNLGLLGVFKYFDFFAESMALFLGSVGLGSWATWPTLNLVLPAGISFYTFQTLSYTIDIYRGKLKATKNLLDFSLFVAFFPQLVAGPIERASHFIPQVASPRTVTFDATTRGLFLILLGLFKKVAIADGCAPAVNAVFASPGEVGSVDVILATYLFAAQIYCDFSGYSDIARGTSKLMGFDLMENFDVPYLSTGPSEFWRRWHISLSTWLRDYLYIPLGGSRAGTLKTYRNLMATMLLGGLWHGAAWNFVLWGLYQGALLCGHRLIVGPGPGPTAGRGPLGVLRRLVLAAIFFQAIAYGWLLFRAGSLEQIWRFTLALLTPMSGLEPVVRMPPLSALAGIAMLIVLDGLRFITGTPRFYRSWPLPIRAALYAALLLILIMGTSNGRADFIYFQF